MANINLEEFLNSGYGLRAVRDRLESDVKKYLKDHLMASAESEIDKIVDLAVTDLKTQITSMRHSFDFIQELKITVNRKASSEGVGP